jgi:hypothetical protein
MNQPPVFTIANLTGPDVPDAIQIRFELPRGPEYHNKAQTMAELSTFIDNIQKVSFNQGEPDHKILRVTLGEHIDQNIINLFNAQIVPNEYYLVEESLTDGYMWNVTNLFKAPPQIPFVPYFMMPGFVHQPAPVEPVADAPAVREAEVFPTGEATIPFAQRLECGICMGNAVNTRLNPCGHLLCSRCFALLDPKRCPTCRVEPVNGEPIFYGGYYNKYQKYMNKLL